MTRLLIVGEDALCCALGSRLVEQVLPGWHVSGVIDKRGITRLTPELPRYLQASAVQPVLCIADTDGRCAAELVSAWLPKRASARLLLRLAVNEAESWVLADAEAVSEGLAVNIGRVPREPERLDDAKRAVLGLAQRSRDRRIRQEMISPSDPNRPGSGYNLHLVGLVTNHWQAQRAVERSPSLRRAWGRLVELAA